MNRAIWFKVISILLLLLVISFWVMLFTGPAKGFNSIIMLKIRLPRILLGIIVGAALAASGCIFQGLLRNPLAGPYVLGTSSGAALGASLAMVLDMPFMSYSVFFFSIAGAIIAIFLVYNIASSSGRASIHTLILSGIVTGTFFSALVLLIMSIYQKDAHRILFFLMGSLQETDFKLIWLAGVFALLGISVGIIYSSELNIILQGEETAMHLGIEVEKVKKILFFTVSLMTGAVVAVSGMIGFVGLVIPHLVRLVIGPDHRILLPASILAGAVFLIIADGISRTILAPSEIPVGVITALCGAPFFIFLLTKKKGV